MSTARVARMLEMAAELADDERLELAEELGERTPDKLKHRIWVGLVLGMLEGGMRQDEILGEYPSLEPADIQACLAYALELTRVRFVDLPQAS